LALLISIPAINLFTHGTHITVAHSMGTTIGINTLILLSSVTYILESTNRISAAATHKIRWSLCFFNSSFMSFWLTLLVLGVKKSYWTSFCQKISFAEFQDSLHWIYIFFLLFGIVMATGLFIIVFELLKILKSATKINL
jgi:nitric oxide reductase subunit B